MLRWMICPVVGNGTIETPYRGAVSDVSNVNVAQVIPTFNSGPNVGKPKYHFAICLVATASVNPIAAVSNSYVFPDYNLDGRMDGMNSDARTGLVQSVQAYDLDGNGLHVDASHADGDSYRDLISKIGQQFDVSFTINGQTCAEVAG